MKIIIDNDGRFALLFEASESELGIEILNSIIPDNEEGGRVIDDAIRSLKYAGVPIPDNVVPIH